MQKFNISQIPVVDINGFVGSIDESDLFLSYMKNKAIADKPIREIMGKAYPVLKKDASVEEVARLFQENAAVLIDMENGKHQIVTKNDLIGSIK